MKAFQLMARILMAIKLCELKRRMNPSLFSTDTLEVTDATRDSMITKLQREGYVEGFYIDKTKYKAYPEIDYYKSEPCVTIKGLAFIAESEILKKAVETMEYKANNEAAFQLSQASFLL